MTSTDSTRDVDKVVQAACDAAARGDAAKVMKCLDSRPAAGFTPLGLDEPLMPSSTLAKYLLENMSKFHAEHALRALMSLPSCYETPWRAALEFIQALYDSNSIEETYSEQVVLTCMADIQTFLQLTVESWWKRKRQQSALNSTSRTMKTPRHLLKELVDAILKPLTKPISVDNRRFEFCLELLSSVVSLCQALEEEDENGDRTIISNYALNRLFPTAVRPDRLLPWLTFLLQLRPHLRDEDWTRLYDILKHAVTNDTSTIPSDDLQGLVRGIVSLVVKQQQQCENEENQDWKLLILDFISSSSRDETAYVAVEAQLKASLSSLPNAILRKLFASIKDASDVPSWISANMNLLLLHVTCRSGSHELVASMVASALGNNRRGNIDDTNMLKRQCLESLKELMIESATEKLPGHSPSGTVGTVKVLLEGVCYDGCGQFSRAADDSTTPSIIASKLVCQSVFLGSTKPSLRSQRDSSVERAHLWLQAAEAVLRSSLDSTGAEPTTRSEVLFAILILVTVYCEVPDCRPFIVRTMIQCLSGRDGYVASDEDLSLYYCVAVAMIVRSASHEDSPFNDITQELLSLTEVFEASLANGVFYDLTTALAPLPQARLALLSASRNHLQLSFGGNLWWDMGAASSRGMQENRGKVDCALQGLCTIISTSENRPSSDDDCRLEAWTTLSDAIVLDKPAIPTSERSGLFRRLASFTQESKFSSDTIDHLMRACLVRLLQFFDGENECTLELALERLVVSWGASNVSQESSSFVGQREDIVGILRLVMTLLEKQAEISDAPGNYDLCQCREKVLEMLGEEFNACDRVVTGEDIDDSEMTSEETSPMPSLGSDIASSCLAGILRSALSSNVQADNSVRDEGQTVLPRLIDRWRERLISDEIEACSKGREIVVDPDRLPLWVKHLSPETADTVIHSTACDSDTRRRLLSSLCDILLDLMFHPIWSIERTELARENRELQQRKETKCAVSLLVLKHNLSRPEGRTKAKETDVPDLNFDATSLIVSAVPLLELCTGSIDTSISDRVALRTIEDTVLSLLAFCSALQEFAYRKETSGQAPDTSKKLAIARCLWKLYLVVGDEKSARGFVSYLEAQGVAQLKSEEGVNQVNHDDIVAPPDSEMGKITANLSFLTIQTDEDVDRIVQFVRLSIVSTMNAWVESLLNSHTESSNITTTDIFQDFPPQTGSGPSVSFSLDVLRQLGSDIRTGLDGHSGGMTEALYNAYLSLIECSCRLVSVELPLERDVSSLSRVPSVAVECATYLKQVLCTFPVKNASQFKRTMTLTMSQLPATHWQANLILAMSEKDHPLLSTNDFSIDVFYQMMEIAERFHRPGRVRGKTWADTVGTEHFDPSVDDVESDDSLNRVDELDGDSSVDESFLGVPSKSLMADRAKRTKENRTSSLEQKDRKVQLPLQESWLWASTCSLSSMEGIWVTSVSILNGDASSTFRPAPSSSHSFGSYCLERTKVLSDTLRAICYAMKSLEELKHATAASLGRSPKKKKKATIILASTLADAVKVKLCSLLETISDALQIALRSVSDKVKTGDGVDPVVRAESMACMSAWLAVEEDELDLESLSIRWYHYENKRRSDKSKAGGNSNKRSSLTLKRLPKFLVGAQELETDLSKFYQVLVQMEDDKTIGPQRQQTLEQYESLLYTQAENETSLQSMIKTKLNSLAKARSFSGVFNVKLAGKGNESPAAPPKRSRKATPSLERQMEQEKRRKAKRSRNTIVDEWMHLDDEHEMDEGFDGDAYVDLEDFIV